MVCDLLGGRFTDETLLKVGFSELYQVISGAKSTKLHSRILMNHFYFVMLLQNAL